MAGQLERRLVAGNSTTAMSRAARQQAGVDGSPWDFWLMRVVAMILILPVVCLARLLPAYRREHRDETIFAETNRTVLTAIGTAFML